MIVIDANLLVAFCVPSNHSQTAERVWQADSMWHAPRIWVSEFRNALVGYPRRKLLDWSECAKAMERARLAVPESHTHEANDHGIFELCAGSGCSAYDCEYVWLAGELGVHLLTWDKVILRQSPEIALMPEGFLAQRREEAP